MGVYGGNQGGNCVRRGRGVGRGTGRGGRMLGWAQVCEVEVEDMVRGHGYRMFGPDVNGTEKRFTFTLQIKESSLFKPHPFLQTMSTYPSHGTVALLHPTKTLKIHLTASIHFEFLN